MNTSVNIMPKCQQKKVPLYRINSISGNEKILLQPYNYIIQIPGKQIRAKLIQAFNHWLNVPEEKLEIIGDVTRMLHNASLLIDDIEDASNLRRGIPVAHHIYGIGSTINSANYSYFLGMEHAMKLEHPKVVNVYTEQMLELHRGQGMDVYWRDNFQCPTEEQYCEMVIQKTGGLFGLAIRMMELFSDFSKNLNPFLESMGLYFQIRDDYANLCSEDYANNKSFAEDLTEGKFSYPIIHALNNSDQYPAIMNILRQRTEDVDVKKYCVKLIKGAGSLDYCVVKCKELESEMRAQIKELGGNAGLEKMIDALAKVYENA